MGDELLESPSIQLQVIISDWPSYSASTSSIPSPATTSEFGEGSIIQPGVRLDDTADPVPLDGTLLKERQIGGSQHSDLYKGVWALPGYDYTPVALKYIRLYNLGEVGDSDLSRMERLSKRITRETNIWKAMAHPNILPFYGYQTMDEQLVLVSMWCGEGDLCRFLAHYPDLTIIDKLELLHEAASGLAFLHSLDPPIAHGGLKPDNVIVTDDIHASLCDVGLSRVMTALGVRTGLTTGGQGVESVGYLAGELYNDNARPTSMSDVYAFGGLILTTISGKRPFWRRRANGAIVIAISRGVKPEPKDHPRLPDADPLWNTLGKCWSLIPMERPDMMEVMEQLKFRILLCEESWNSDAPKRTRSRIPTTERRSATVSGSGPGRNHSTPVLSPATASILPPAPPEGSLFQPGAPIRDLLPQFKLEGTLLKFEKIGSGGFGDVFKGVWKRSDDQLVLVAIKYIKGNVTVEKSGEANDEQADLMTRIIRETTIWKVAEHPNILSFYGYQIVGGEAMLVSPWCKNGSLNSYISKHEELRDTQKLKLLCDAAQGLVYLHSSKPPIAHGDIKPENVIITDELKSALCDFGIARVMSDFTTGLTTRSPGAGTTRYQAKELLLGSSQPTNMSDVYAFGGLILATMSGKPPFHLHKTAPSIILAINQDQTPSPADHPELNGNDPLWNLLRRCWSAQPSKRPSVAQVIRTLEAEIRRRSSMEADLAS